MRLSAVTSHSGAGRSGQRGMSLVEVLVALVVLSVGMLGVAVLFVQSIRSSRSAVLRTQAVNLVSDMADRIRANAAARGAYDTAQYIAQPQLRGCAPAGELATGSNCDPEQLAEDDLAHWQQAVRAALPALPLDAPMATVQYVPAPAAHLPERYRVRVSWQEPNATAGESSAPQAPYSYQTDVVLLPRP